MRLLPSGFLALTLACSRTTEPNPVATSNPTTASSTAPDQAPTGGAGVRVGDAGREVPPGWRSPGAPASRPGVIRILPGSLRMPAAHVDPIHQVEVDDKDVFFLDGAGFVWRAPKDGSGTASAVWDASRGHATDFTLQGADVLVSARAFGGPPTLSRLAKSGGAPSTLSTESEDALNLVHDDQNVWFSLFDGTSLRRLSLAGGTSVAVRTPGIKNGALAIDADPGGFLYVADYDRNRVSKIAKSTGVETVLTSAPHPTGIRIDETHVYFACEDDESLRRIPKAGGAVQTLATQQQNADSMAVDSTWLYWTAWGGAPALLRTKKDGSGSPAVLLGSLHEPTGVTVDATKVYVANKGDGEVLVVSK